MLRTFEAEIAENLRTSSFNLKNVVLIKKNVYAGSSPENASVVRTLFDLFSRLPPLDFFSSFAFPAIPVFSQSFPFSVCLFFFCDIVQPGLIILNLNPRSSGVADELSQLRHSESQLKTQLQDVKKRENVLVLKLAAKEQEVNEYRVGPTGAFMFLWASLGRGVTNPTL